MGQARHKGRQTQNGIRTVSNGAPSGTRVNAPPPANRGGKVDEAAEKESGQSVTDRSRVNVSLPAGVHRALLAAADSLDTSVSAVALAAIMAGLPGVAEQVESVKRLSSS